MKSSSLLTWMRHTFISERNYWCHSIVFHPQTKGTILATFTEQGAQSGIWRTKSGGQKWVHLTKGLPDSARFGRTTLAISRSKPDVIYAFAKDEASSNKDLLLGVFRTSNGGLTWTNRSNGLIVTMFYDMDIAQSKGLVFGGGAQDNGTVITTDGTSDTFYELLDGDGGWIVFDPQDAGHA